MKQAFNQIQLYTFLLYCNGTGLEKTILDCGAGGRIPPLAIFKVHGYQTYGVDNNQNQIKLAHEFEKANGTELNIIEGDMLNLHFEDGTVNFVYSYNSIFHMSKDEIGKVIDEIYRVLPSSGLAFVNFPTIHDWRFEVGEKVGDGEYLQEEHGEKILHSYFRVDEPEEYFDNFNIIYKETRNREGYIRKGTKITRGFVDYILEKK